MNLRELNLSNNDIEKIENLNHLKNLHILNLSFNKISKIENISVLKQLEILNLSNNLIEEIPPIIVKNANIFELNLANNMISEKNSILNLKSLPKLALLDLSNNPITEIPSYPTFVYHILKKLCTLDNKMTPNYAKAQNPGPLNTKRQLSQPPKEETPQSPAFSYDYSANEQHEAEEENTPQSYEQRLKVTQNRLNELNMLNKKVQLLSTEDIANRRLRNPFRKIEIDSKVHNPPKQMNEKQERRGEQERAIFNQNFSTNSLVSVQDKIQQQYASIPSFVVNEHTLYSVSESGHDMRFKSNMMPDSKENTLTYRNSNKDSNETQSTVSPQKRYYEFPSSHVNEFKSSSIDHLQHPNSNIHLNNFELLASSAQTPQEKEAPNWNQRILLRKVVEKESDDAQQIQGRILDNMLTNRHLPPRQLEQVNTNVKSKCSFFLIV